MLKKTIAFIVVISTAYLTGCATGTPIKYDVANLEQSEQFAIKDLRPETEKKQKVFSYLITSKAYGVYRISEATSGLTRIRLLQHRIYEKLGADSSNLDVKVHHFVTYMNNSASVKKAAWGSALGGVVGAIIVSSADKKTPLPAGVSYVNGEVFESIIDEEYQRGYYTEQENPEKSDVLIIYLDAEINGKRTFLRRISQIIPDDKTHIFLEAVNSTIQALLAEY